MFNGLAENRVWHRHRYRYRYNMDKQKQHGLDVLHTAASESVVCCGCTPGAFRLLQD